MSYILDALKKSEQERGHGNIPDVQTVHSSSLSYRDDKKAYWPYFLIVAVILNLLAITYFILNKEKPVDTQVTAEKSNTIAHAITESSPTVEETGLPTSTSSAVKDNKDVETAELTLVTTATADKQIAAPAKTTSNNTQAADQGIDISTRQESTVESSEAKIIDFHDLPESIKQQLPAIIISAHVYSSNPIQRSVVINNNFMEEGEYVLDGLILYEITTDGAVFNYQGTLFNYGVVSGWQ